MNTNLYACLAVINNSVNKTSLHPGGVKPNHSHTELEEELHETAHIDYDRVSIIANPSVAELYEDALVCFRVQSPENRL
jgi:phosphoenolpyruvate carboxykinase (ATP)